MRGSGAAAETNTYFRGTEHMHAIMAVAPRDINFKHKLITHKIKVAPHMSAQSADVRAIKTHRVPANTAHALHDTVESYIYTCFKYFRWS